MPGIRDEWAYIAIPNQPEIKYEDVKPPPTGWTFNSLDELECKALRYTFRCGYTSRHRRTKPLARYYQCTSPGCMFSGKAVSNGGKPLKWCIGPPVNATHTGHNPTVMINEPELTTVNIIFVGLPVGPLLDETGSAADFAVKFATPGHDERLESSPKCDIARAAVRLQHLGNAFVLVQGGDLYVDELLVTALAAATQNEHFHLTKAIKWNGNMSAELTKALSNVSTETLLFTGVRGTPPPARTLSRDEIWRLVQSFLSFNRKLRSFPHPSEAMLEEDKLGDLSYFQTIARQAELAGLNWLTSRPRTCFGLGQCQLPYDARTHTKTSKMVVKQSHSCGGDGVRIVHPSNRAHLRCLTKGNRWRALHPQKHHFHQEYIPSLKQLEFRSFIEFDTSPEAMDGLASPGKIIAIYSTAPDDDGSTAKVQQLEISHLDEFFPQGSQEAYEKLVAFCKLQYVALLAISDTEVGFRSVNTVCRIDIGIMKDGNLFINELSRGWNAAHYGLEDDIMIALSLSKTIHFQIQKAFCSSAF